MKSLKRAGVALAAASALVLAGCQKPEQLQDGYQFGDLSSVGVESLGDAVDLYDRYCHQGDQRARHLLLMAVRVVYPDYPGDGLCTDPLLLTEMAAARLSKHGEAPPPPGE